MTRGTYLVNGVFAVIFSVFVLAVSASVTEKILKVPLFEVGELWLKSFTVCLERLVSLCTTMPDFYSWTTYVWIAILIVGFRYFHLIFIAKLNRVRQLGDLGYLKEGSLSMKQTANAVRKRRKLGDVPPVYPNGWFGLIESHSVKIGEAKNISVLGLQLAVFRGESGESHAVDAYCPHMGANLAVGGRVVGDCLECPFHGWQFRGYDGKCTKIPYADKIPDLAKVKSYITCETNGWIYLWFHAEGSEPTWKIPEIDDINNGSWTYRGRTEHHVNAHIEEVPENGADVSHLAQVHSPFLPSGIDLCTMWSKFWSFGQHQWTASWEQNPEPEQHIGTLKLTHNLSLFGKTLPFLNMHVSARQIGPGIVYMNIETFFGKGVFIMSLTPSAPMMQNMVHNIYIDTRCPTFIAKIFLIGEAMMVERDIMIWNNKQYEGRPMFVKSKEDSLIAKHRRWFQQFYSENSPRLTFQKDTMDW